MAMLSHGSRGASVSCLPSKLLVSPSALGSPCLEAASLQSLPLLSHNVQFLCVFVLPSSFFFFFLAVACRAAGDRDAEIEPVP